MACKHMNRRDFMKYAAAAGVAVALPFAAGCSKNENKAYNPGSKKKNNPVDDIGLKVSRGSDDPKKLVKAAIDAAGGMRKFVGNGDIVAVKPNIGWNRTPEQAANTNPLLIAAIIEMCFEAGAKKVKVFDNTCNTAPQCYKNSGIEDAAKKAGAEVSFIDERKFKEMSIPEGEDLKSWDIYTDAIETDVLINVPILKHHSLARITMGMKNLMGVIGGNRSAIHPNFRQKIADLNTVIKPQLTIIDAYRVLKDHGPNSGTVDDVALVKQVIAGTDPIAVDSYAASLFAQVTGQNFTGMDIDYLRTGYQMGLGEIDISKVDTQIIDVA